MKLLIHTGDSETSMDASPDAIHSVLNPPSNIDYGTTFSLTSSDNWTLAAICVTNVYLPPTEEGGFLLILDNGESHKECLTQFTRNQIVEYLNKFLASDISWVDNFDWYEV
jgi:hypothetical protein